jgi:hypothetical protein
MTEQDEDDLFADQVHDIVCQLDDWMMEKRPRLDQLMPALAVMLGRLIAARATTASDITALVKMAMTAIVSAGEEAMEVKIRDQEKRDTVQ